MRWLTNFYDFRFKSTATAGIRIYPTKDWLSQLVNFKNAVWTWGHFRRKIYNKILFKLGKNATKTYGILQTAFGASCINRASVFERHKRFKEGRESVRNDERCGRSKEVRTPLLIGQIKNFIDKDSRVSIETISAQFDVSVGTVHTIIREELKMRKICTKFVPSLSQTIWPKWALRQFVTLPLVHTLLPMTFGFSLSSRKTLEAVVMRQLRRWKRLWRRSLTRSHKRSSMRPSRGCWNGTTSALQPEEITSKGTRVSCVYYQYKCPYEKKSGNLLKVPRNFTFVEKWVFLNENFIIQMYNWEQFIRWRSYNIVIFWYYTN